MVVRITLDEELPYIQCPPTFGTVAEEMRAKQRR